MTLYVNPETQTVQIRVLISLAFGQKLMQRGVRPSQLSISFADLFRLTQIVYPDLDFWNLGHISLLKNLRMAVMEQHPTRIGGLQVGGITPMNYDGWIQDFENREEAWIPMYSTEWKSPP